MSSILFTTYNKRLYDEYAHHLVESYAETNQKLRLFVFVEDNVTLYPSVKNVTYLDLFQHEPELRKFIERNKHKPVDSFFKDAVRFSYKEDCPIYVGNDSRYGFIAQELQEILPELVDEAGFPKRVPTSPDEEIEDPGTYLRYADDASKQLIAILTKALQESISKIESLESRISALESNQ